MTRNGSGTIKIWVNGTLDATHTSHSYALNSTAPLIGKAQWHGDMYYTGYMDEMRISNTERYTANFTPNEGLVTSATGTAISTANTALTAPTTGDICMLIENASGTATLNTDLKAYVSRNGGTGWDQATLVDKGSWGTNKKILTANNVAFSNSASGTDMRYKIEWANQASGSKETRVHATSLAWA